MHRGARRPAGLRPLARRGRPRRAGSGRSGWCSPAPRRWPPTSSTAFTERTGRAGAPGLRPHRGGAGGHQHAVQRRTRCRGSVGGAAARHRPAAGRRAGPVPAGTTPARSRSGATTSSAATGPTAPTAPTTTAGGRPGDVGFLDADGDLFLVDRVKELVIVSGFNVYPVEVEEVIAEVEGVARGGRHRRRGRARPARRSWPTSSAAGLDPVAAADAVRAHCASRLARFKQPSRVEVVERAARTPSPARCRRAGCAASSGAAALGLLE